MNQGSRASLIALLALLSTRCGEPSQEVCSPGGECMQPASGGSKGVSGQQGGRGGQTQAQRPELGAPCQSQGDCPDGAHCLTERGSGLRGGGPPQGMCVADCSTDPRACEAFSQAVCVIFDGADAGSAFCFPACKHGTASLAKCGGRADLACEKLEDEGELGFCRPFCQMNEECESGRCDRRNGVCVQAEVGGDDFGRPCSLQGDLEPCSGICVAMEGTDLAFCSHRCVYGSAAPCGPLAGAPGLCALSADGGSLGDVGYCAELCDCSEQCTHPDLHCDAFSSAAVRDRLGKAGVCAVATEPDPEPLVCKDSVDEQT